MRVGHSSRKLELDSSRRAFCVTVIAGHLELPFTIQCAPPVVREPVQTSGLVVGWWTTTGSWQIVHAAFQQAPREGKKGMDHT